ncbi:MAG: hypothetical protein U0835_24355 [Isosphaeraceae bacterium]
MNGEVVIVDEFTGRMMPGRQWQDGLHQAIQAKERLEVTLETITAARVTPCRTSSSATRSSLA